MCRGLVSRIGLHPRNGDVRESLSLIHLPKAFKTLLHLLLLLLILVFSQNITRGQILTFEFSALAGSEATAGSNSNDANLTTSTISRGAGLTASNNGGRFNATSWALTSIANAVSGDDYMEFTITPNGGFQFDVSSIFIQLQRSSTGPSAIALRSSVDGYTANLDAEKAITDNTSTQTFTFTFTQSNSASAVTYRIYKYAEATGGSGGIGDGGGNDIIVTGTTSASCSAEPTAQATNITFSSIGATSMDVSWTAGSGGDKNILVVKQGANVSWTPTDATSYSAQTGGGDFSVATDQGSGNKVVYDGVGTSTTVTGLTASTTYYFQVFHYCSATSDDYLTSTGTGNDGTQNQATTAPPPVVLMSWDYSGNAGNEATVTAGFIATNISGTSPSGVVSRGAGLTASSNANRYNANNWGLTNLATAVTDNDYMEWTITPNAGYQMTLTSIEFNWERSSTGADEVTLRSDQDSYVSNLGTITALGTSGNNESIALSGFTDLSVAVTFRLYGYSATGSAGTGGFEGAGDDLEIMGNVTSCSEPTTQATNLVFSNQAGCSMTIGWTNGGGKGRIVKMNSSNSFTAPVDGTDPTASSTWLGSELVVYNGTGSSVNVDGLTVNTTYWFRVYDYNCSGGGIDFLTTTGTNNPLSGSSNACTAPTTEASSMTFTSVTNTSMHVNWTNGDGTYRIVVCEQASSPTGLPVDFTTYTADQTFNNGQSTLSAGEYIVYSGSSDNFTLLGLTASTTYDFKVYEYNCIDGCEVFLTTAPITGSQATIGTTNPTVLSLGDLAVLGLCSNTAACLSTSAGDDEISFVCFVDITEGTEIEMTDNGWERLNTGQWGNTEGVIQATRTGATIPAGTVITFRFSQDATGTYTAFSPDAGWTISEIHSLGSDLIMNAGGDQIFFMQGGTWAYGTANNHDATITSPNILFGFNSNNIWSASNSTQHSNPYPGMDCFSMMPDAGASDYIKYTGDLSKTNQRTWLDRVSTSSNWTSYNNCTDYYAGAPQYHNGYTIEVDNGGFTSGEWTGSRSIDWFNCGNWKSMEVPDQNVNVVFPTGSVVNECTIGAPPSGYTEASTNDLTISTGRTLTIDDASSLLDIYGNYTNNATLSHTNGTVTFKSGAAQNLGGSSSSSFFKFTLSNSSATGVTLSAPVTVNSILLLTDGFMFTDATNILTLIDGATSSVGSSTTFVDGPMKKIGDDAFVFPTGDGTKWARIAISAPTVDAFTEYTAQYFATGYGDYTLDGNPILNNVSIKEYWTLDQAVNIGDNVKVKLFWENNTTSGINQCDGTDLRVAHWDAGNSWWEINVDGSLIAGGCPGPDGSVESNLVQTEYSPFTFSSKSAAVNPLPINLLYFSGVYNPNSKQVDLEWATASETNNDFFTIERSTDGLDFEVVSVQTGAGNSNSLLLYEDIDPFPMKEISYYRLKQTDYDGQFEYSKLVAVNVIDLEDIKIWPNPADDEIEVQLSETVINTAFRYGLNSHTLSIIDGTGKEITHMELEIITDKIIVNTSQLDRGLYLLSLNFNGEIFTSKFIKR